MELKAIEVIQNILSTNGNLRDADLSGIDLSGANLKDADLSGADLSEANLASTNLNRTNLTGACLIGANLYGAKLSKANLSKANLSRANLAIAVLSEADLTKAILTGANLYGAKIYNTIGLSEYCTGKILTAPIIGYKACRDNGKDVLVTLEIPRGATVFSINEDQCRTNKAKVIDIEGSNRGKSYFYDVSYYVGDVFTIYNFNCQYNKECTNGIHFFLNKEDAYKYMFKRSCQYAARGSSKYNLYPMIGLIRENNNA